MKLTWANAVRTLVRIETDASVTVVAASNPAVEALRPKIEAGEFVIGDYVPPAAAQKDAAR